MICCPLFGDSAGDGAGLHRLFGQKGDGKRREICLKGLEPFGLAGFGRIWGHVGECCPVGRFLGKRGAEPGQAKRAQNSGRCGQHQWMGGVWRKYGEVGAALLPVG